MALSINRKVRLGLVIGSRAVFSPAPCLASRTETPEQFARPGIAALILPDKATANGAVQSIADAEVYAAFFKQNGFEHHVETVDGHDHPGLLAVLDHAQPQTKPFCVIADTVKGKGVSSMENAAAWHHGVPNTAQSATAMQELV